MPDMTPTAGAPAGGATGTILDTPQPAPAPPPPAASQQPVPFTDNPTETTSDAQASSSRPNPQPASSQPTGGGAPQAGSPQAGSPQGGQGGQQGGQQGAQTASPENPANPNKPDAATPQTPAATPPPPGVQRAGVLRTIAQTLAGGQRYKTTVDPNTGQTTRTPVPLSRGDIGMAIVAEVLSGAMSGLSAQPGPGVEGRAAAAGFQQGMQQRQQADAQQAQLSSDDYARSAAITKTNFQTHANALKLSQMDHDYHQQFVAQQKPILDNINEVGAALAHNVNESELGKYHVTKDMAIADGVVPRIDPATGKQAKNQDGSDAWDNTYTIIDPKAQIALPEGEGQFLADHLVKGFYKMVGGKPVPMDLPADTRMRASFVVGGNAAAQNVKLTEDTINRQLQGLGKDAEGDTQQFEVNLKKALATGSLSPDGMKTLSQYATLPLNQIIPAMEKAKVKPDLIGQVMSILPQDAIKTMNTADAKLKSDAATQAAVGKQTALASGAVNEAGKKAYTDGYNHEQGSIAAKKANGIPLSSGGGGEETPSNTALDQYADPKFVQADGVNHTYLDAMAKTDPRRASLLQLVGEGKADPSSYIFAKEYGANAMGDVHIVYPDWNQNLGHAFGNVAKSFTSGKDHDKIVGINTTLIHAADAFQNTGWTAQNADPKYSTEATKYKDDISRVAEGVNSAYTHGVLDKDTRNDLLSGLNSRLPSVAKASLQEYVKLMAGAQVDSLYSTYQTAKPSAAIPDFPIVTAKGAEAYKAVMNEPIDPKYLGQSTRLQNPSGNAANLPPTQNSGGGQQQTQQAKKPFAAPPGAPSAQGVADGIPLAIHGKVVGVAKGGQWVAPPQQIDPKTGGPISQVEQPHPSSPYQYVSPSGQHGWNGQQWEPIARPQATQAAQGTQA